MSVCIGPNCYEKVTKNDRIYFIKAKHLMCEKLSTKSKTNVLMQYADFVFDIVKSKYGTEELIMCPC